MLAAAGASHQSAMVTDFLDFSNACCGLPENFAFACPFLQENTRLSTVLAQERKDLQDTGL